MKRHLNLMTPQSIQRQCVREIIGRFKAIAIIVLVTVTVYSAHLQRQALSSQNHRLALDAQYAPIGAMLHDTRDNYAREERIKHDHAAILALSLNQPPLSLVHAVSSAVIASKNEVIIEDFIYQSAGRLSESTSPSNANHVLNVAGLAKSDAAISAFVRRIRELNLFDSAKLKSTVAKTVDREVVKQFQLECRL